MRKLIVSWDTYSWALYCSTKIILDYESQYIVIVADKDLSPMAYYDGLCDDAILAQRRHDLFCIGKELKIQRLEGVLYSLQNIESIITYIQLQILIGGIKEIYFQYDCNILYNMFLAIKKKIDIPIYGYNTDKNVVLSIDLTETEILNKKQLIKNCMKGISSKYYNLCPTKETFGGVM